MTYRVATLLYLLGVVATSMAVLGPLGLVLAVPLLLLWIGFVREATPAQGLYNMLGAALLMIVSLLYSQAHSFGHLLVGAAVWMTVVLTPYLLRLRSRPATSLPTPAAIEGER